MAAPEAESTVSTKLAGLVARAKKEDRLTNVVQYVDEELLRLLNNWLKAGVVERGVVTQASEGVPQGGPVSPVLANVYLHYVLDLRFERRFKKNCRSVAELTRRFADDFMAVFRDQQDAERFQQELEGRLAAFGLRVAPEKTAKLRFDGSLLRGPGRPVERPATFTFLGFTHYLTKARSGCIHLGRKPSAKARERFLCTAATWLTANQHVRVRAQQANVTRML
ncbi:MAG: hypothetical protein IT306_11310 [Chloroflexi bacterium]|nr:hypothetical protein [Chloroflexota bacterium]